MDVYFYSTFSKRPNSTKRPNISSSDTGHVTHSCYLKDNCSEHDPVFILGSNVFNYTYAYVPDWHKFYYTVDVISIANGRVEYHMKEDLLASYAANIASTTARVIYSSYYYDEYLIDSRIQIKNSRQCSTKVPNPNNPVFSSVNGWYILSVLSNVQITGVTLQGGFAKNYIVSPTGMDKIRRWFCIDNFLTQLYQYYHGRPLDSVFKCIWVPYNIDQTQVTIYGQTSAVIGNLDSGDFGVTFQTGELGIIDGHPFQRMDLAIDLGRRYTDFRRSEPYTTGQIFLPGVGLVDVCYGDFRGVSGISVYVTIEVLTGNISYDIMVSGDKIQHVESNVAAEVPIGSDTLNVGGFMNGIASLITGGASLTAGSSMMGSGAIAANAAGVIVGAANTVLNANKHTQTVQGSIGGHMAANGVYVYLQEYTVNTEDPNDSDYIRLHGRPYDGMSVLADLLPQDKHIGYIQCIGARVQASQLDPLFGVTVRPTIREQEEINEMLDAGFYLETS